MKKFYFLILLVFLAAASMAKSQITTPILAKAGLATAEQTAQQSGIPNMQLYFVGTFVGSYSGFDLTFDMNTGKATAWIYVYRSKTLPDSIQGYVVVKILTLTTVLYTLSGQDVLNMIPIPSDSSLNGLSYDDSDVMIGHVKADTTYQRVLAADPDLAPALLGLGINTIEPTLDLFKPYWYLDFEGAGTHLYCYEQAQTGAVQCDEVITSVEDAARKETLTLYPNPATNYTMIRVPGWLDVSHSSFELYSSDGSLAGRFDPSQFGGSELVTLALGQYCNGVYFLKVSSQGHAWVMKLTISR